MSQKPPYPWQDTTFQHLQHAQKHHALLMSGPTHTGQPALVQAFAQGCIPDWKPAHPDWQWIAPEEGGSISIDTIRDLLPFFYETPEENSRKIALIEEADKMTPPAQNALLKTLEEPNVHALLVLLSERPEKLLPTIRSRCLKITVPIPSTRMAEDWLVLQGVENPAFWLQLGRGKPLLAQTLSQSIDAALIQKTWPTQLQQLTEKQESPITMAQGMVKTPHLALDWLVQQVAVAYRRRPQEPLWQLYQSVLTARQQHAYERSQNIELVLSCLLAQWQLITEETSQ